MEIPLDSVSVIPDTQVSTVAPRLLLSEKLGGLQRLMTVAAVLGDLRADSRCVTRRKDVRASSPAGGISGLSQRKRTTVRSKNGLH
jgi:hypothetical protein